ESPAGKNGTKTKNATSCGNVFVTNILLARSRAPRKASAWSGNQLYSDIITIFFIMKLTQLEK
ncbi:hypothetical protein, partial [Paenisporosarcina sp. TG20]|uniref:hypothetical protein n=1 Tax=Paenisporosarcina sp. TG20 TaxID=1211706 RepID=UPI00059258E2